MSLPKWVKRITNDVIDRWNFCDQDVIDLREALSIAWEALEHLEKYQIASVQRHCRRALRRIANLAAKSEPRQGEAAGGEKAT